MTRMQMHSPDAQDGGQARLAEARPATRTLRDVLDVTEDFTRAMAESLEVNATDLNAMQHLIMAGPLSPSALAKRLGLSTAATTTAIDRLEAVGHVRRSANPEDRRGVIVEATPASRDRAMRMLVPMIVDVDRVLDEFSDAEQRAIGTYLKRVVSLYRSHAASLGATPTR